MICYSVLSCMCIIRHLAIVVGSAYFSLFTSVTMLWVVRTSIHHPPRLVTLTNEWLLFGHYQALCQPRWQRWPHFSICTSRPMLWGVSAGIHPPLRLCATNECIAVLTCVCALSGTLPSSWAALTSLQYMCLFDNALSGKSCYSTCTLRVQHQPTEFNDILSCVYALSTRHLAILLWSSHNSAPYGTQQ